MWGLTNEILEAFIPYIRKYCDGEISNEKNASYSYYYLE